MKILMIVPQPFFQPRGTPFSVYYRARTLAEMGHQVDIVTYHLGRDVRIPGVRVHRIRAVPFITRIKIGPSLAKLVLDIPLFVHGFFRLFKGRYDYVHAHEEAVFFCLFYKMFFWRMKVLYDMHSSLPQQLRNFRFSSNRALIGTFDALERWSLKRSQGVITICPELQRRVEELNVQCPSVMIENTLFDRVDLEDAGDDVSDELINWTRFEGRKLALYTGTFEPYQGLPIFLEALALVARQCPEITGILIGGTPVQQADIRRRALRLGIKDRIVLTGNLPPNTVKRFLKRADVLASPRISGTNTPLKIYEYLASGKPIVATRHPTHTQILSDREAYLTACDAESFAEGLVAVLTDPALAGRLADGARCLYLKSYGEQFYRMKLETLVTSVAAPRPARAEAVKAKAD